MARRRIRIGLEDTDGAKYEIKLEGNVPREKVLKIFEAMDLMNIEEEPREGQPDSVGGRIWGIIDRQFPAGGFTSTEVLEKYEDEYNVPIKHSIVSTYLARFAEKGRVKRARSGREWTYQAVRIGQRQPRGPT